LKKNRTLSNIKCYEPYTITDTHSIKFIGLIIENVLSWKNHTDQLMSK